MQAQLQMDGPGSLVAYVKPGVPTVLGPYSLLPSSTSGLYLVSLFPFSGRGRTVLTLSPSPYLDPQYQLLVLSVHTKNQASGLADD